MENTEKITTMVQNHISTMLAQSMQEIQMTFATTVQNQLIAFQQSQNRNEQTQTTSTTTPRGPAQNTRANTILQTPQSTQVAHETMDEDSRMLDSETERQQE